jgi:hypothetical protein
VDQVYCHWDGYLDNNGKILYTHYQDPFKLQRIMDLGDLSSLGTDVGLQHSFEDRSDDCTFYGRDRGETGVSAKRFKNFEDYVENHQHEEYEYILRTDGHWYVKCYSAPYVLLGEAIAEEMRKAMEEEALM